mmetsp:Transcript_1009/g.2153  ORF Transcript_1009/g.2153 Transcript_1009/m.2153 type:complete len:203 (-) Transcript_1009:653-1261(-)
MLVLFQIRIGKHTVGCEPLHFGRVPQAVALADEMGRDVNHKFNRFAGQSIRNFSKEVAFGRPAGVNCGPFRNWGGAVRVLVVHGKYHVLRPHVGTQRRKLRYVKTVHGFLIGASGAVEVDGQIGPVDHYSVFGIHEPVRICSCGLRVGLVLGDGAFGGHRDQIEGAEVYQLLRLQSVRFERYGLFPGFERDRFGYCVSGITP